MKGITKRFCVLSASLVLTGCSGIKLSQDGKRIKVLEGSPPEGCFALDPLTATSEEEDRALIMLKNFAGDREADYVRIDQKRTTKRGHAEVTGTPFACGEDAQKIKDRQAVKPAPNPSPTLVPVVR